MAEMSLNVPYLKPGTIGAKGDWYFGFGVALREPIVRPWKELWKDSISVFEAGERVFPTFRANFIAASLASLPLLQMNVLEADDMPDVAWVSWMSCLLSWPVKGLW